MFRKIFKKKIEEKPKLQCEHDWQIIGKYYKVYKSIYRNNFDCVSVYIKMVCPKYGKVLDHLLGEEKFDPSMFRSYTGQEKYIKKLEKDGIMTEIEMNERIITNTLNKGVGNE